MSVSLLTFLQQRDSQLGAPGFTGSQGDTGFTGSQGDTGFTGSIGFTGSSALYGTDRNVYTATASQTEFSATYDVGYVDVYLNGIKLVANTDFTATNGSSIILTSGASNGDSVDIVAYSAFGIANPYKTVDGGFANSVYTNIQSIDGGNANG